MTDHSPAPFITEYQPFTGPDGAEIPSFRVYDAKGDVVAETDSGKPVAVQSADAELLAAAPALLAALTQALTALNTAPRFDVPSLDADSYRIASVCSRAIAAATGGGP